MHVYSYSMDFFAVTFCELRYIVVYLHNHYETITKKTKILIMRKTLLSIITMLFVGSAILKAQEVVTYSAYDTNQDSEVTISDVTKVTERLLNNIANDPQMMKAEDVVNAMDRVNGNLELINEKIDKVLMLNGIMPSDFSGHNYVDLGLPSGTLWATMDVGASIAAQAGSFFAWAETEPKDTYTQENYLFADKSITSLTAQYDAATANWGKDWITPNKEMWNELLANCDMTLEAGISPRQGRHLILTSKINGKVLVLHFGAAKGSSNSSTSTLAYMCNAYDSSVGISAYISGAQLSNLEPYFGYHVRAVVNPRLLVQRPNTETTTVSATSITLPTISVNLKTGEAKALTASVMPADATDKSVTWYSSNPGIVSVNNNGVVTANGVGTATVTAIANGGSGLSASCTFTVTKANSTSGGDGMTHEYVDLGLPSGTLWATCNVGATLPSDAGNCYAWGETAPKSEYTWANYFDSAGDKDGNAFKKYAIYLKTKLDLEDDAAYVNWGSDWRMPTKEEVEELKENTTFKKDGNGYVLTSKINKKMIYFPISGYKIETEKRDTESVYIMTSELYNTSKYSSIYQIYYSSYSSSTLFNSTYISRYQGIPIRPVYVGK